MKSFVAAFVILTSLSAQADIVWPRYKVVEGKKAIKIIESIDGSSTMSRKEVPANCPSAIVIAGTYKGFLSKSMSASCRQEGEKALCVLSRQDRGLIASLRTNDAEKATVASKKISAKECSL